MCAVLHELELNNATALTTKASPPYMLPRSTNHGPGAMVRVPYVRAKIWHSARERFAGVTDQRAVSPTSTRQMLRVRKFRPLTKEMFRDSWCKTQHVF